MNLIGFQESYLRNYCNFDHTGKVSSFWTQFGQRSVDEIVRELGAALGTGLIPKYVWVFSTFSSLVSHGNLAVLEALGEVSNNAIYCSNRFIRSELEGPAWGMEVSFICPLTSLIAIVGNSRILHEGKFRFAGWLVLESEALSVMSKEKIVGGVVEYLDWKVCRRFFSTSDDWDSIEFIERPS